GWNSWDCFGTTLTESQAKAQADAMARILKPHGWNYFTVDIQWYEPDARGHFYKEGAPLAMDAHSRLVPAETKFPSAKAGRGFKPLADYIHGKGLKFGIHIMRGIPRQAVRENTPLMGTTARAADIADRSSVCTWNPDMYGVDMRKPGAQAYYDSLFAMYAAWGVDLVKVDDIARPYDATQRAEIEAIRRAIDKTGRPIVLSLSPGDTPIERGDHVNRHANMWRISDDFWDRWEPLYGMFDRLDRWTEFRKPGAWPDADMLPFGIVEFNRPTRFTRDEQTLCMTLWSIARSPLILGADMTRLDAFTVDLLTNDEVLAVNRRSTGGRQVSRSNDSIVWTADIPGSQDKYVALFNVRSEKPTYDLSKALYRSPVVRGAERVDVSVPLRASRSLTLMVEDGGDGFDFDHAAWLEPTIAGPKGTRKLTAMEWKRASAGWGSVGIHRGADGQPLVFEGKKIEGLGTHSISVIEYELPEGYDRFSAKGVLTPGSAGKGSVRFSVLTEEARLLPSKDRRVSVKLADLGFSGRVRARDLWKKKDLGVSQEGFGQDVDPHGAGLYRLSPVP
ncbi:alpha-galactosidase, partial [bacterium]